MIGREMGVAVVMVFDLAMTTVLLRMGYGLEVAMPAAAGASMAAAEIVHRILGAGDPTDGPGALGRGPLPG
ncbi:hypothetical protein [Umezawaea sp. Da 62-37]|uniref:hypothetical protein n=1 Tax=Umezawaea sp. Da 62-37 TaxID=3075927 RepID=UPI0028F73DEE|nr:hypothetical protein [Umezawaea sp. Da 62-37]WNV91322.1 hypothetical protein RM788_24550 [Umezawaea sp. Da 62-37]